MNRRFCPRCNCSSTVKHGKRNGKQRYRCSKCGKTWVNKSRPQRLEQKIWRDYTTNTSTVRELSERYHKHPNTIRRIIHQYALPSLLPSNIHNSSVIIMDATYFGRTMGELLAIDAHSGIPLFCKEIAGSERTIDYEDAIDTILVNNNDVKACIIDGRKGVRDMLLEKGLLVQQCQFHQLQTITQCLTRHPVLTPNIELRNIAITLTRVNRTTFESLLAGWILRHELWLRERTWMPGGKWEYTHKNTRRAYFSLKNNLPWLFTYQDYLELNIPNTANKIDGKFGNAKDKLRIHHGYTKQLRTKIFFSLLSGTTGARKHQ